MKRQFFWLLSAMMVAGCTTDSIEGVQPEGAPITENETFEVQMSPDEAVACVNDLLGTLDVKTRGLGAPRQVGEIHRVKSSAATRAGETPIEHYVINFADNQGFAFVFGDNRLDEPILAVTDNGNLDPEEGTDNPGLITALALGEQWYDRQMVDLETEYELTDADLTDLKSLLTSATETEYMEMPEFVRRSSLELRMPRGGAVIGDMEDYGRRTYLNWGQGYPFNIDLPKIDGKAPKLGCTATATMLLMAWHQFPKVYDGHTYNWTEMLKYRNLKIGNKTSYSTAYPDLAKLAEIITRSGNISTKFGLENSSAYSYNIPRTLKRLGYSNGGTYSSWKEEIVINQLKTHPHYPVIVGGFAQKVDYQILGITIWSIYESGHDFLVETISKKPVRLFYTEKQILKALDKCRNPYIREFLSSGVTFYREFATTLVYVNYGWTGSSNGYYNVGVFNAAAGPVAVTRSGTKKNYQYEIDMVYGIKP